MKTGAGRRPTRLQAEITTLRKALQAYPMVPALKRIVAHFHNDPDWAAVRPPLVPLDQAQSSALIADLAKLGFTPRRAAALDGGIAMAAAERQAFYDRIAPANLAPLWEQLHSLVTPEPTTSCVPALWRYEEVRPHLMQAGGLITAQEAQRRVLDPGEPGFQGAGHDHRLAVCRAAADPARRSRAGPSPYAVGVALYHRGARRLYRGRRRAHRDAAGRFRHHAVLDVARSRQRDAGADGLARRARHPDRQIARAPALPSRLPPRCRR